MSTLEKQLEEMAIKAKKEEKDRNEYIIYWLFRHFDENKTPKEWCDLLNIKIVDPDGWRGRYFKYFNTELSLCDFIERIKKSVHLILS